MSTDFFYKNLFFFDGINSTQDFYVNKLIINKLFIKFS